MKKMIFAFCLSAVAAVRLSAAPSIGNLTVNADKPKLVVSYTLEGVEAAVVTAEVKVDGVPLAPERFLSVSGDIGHVVEPGPRSFAWKAHKDWPNQELKNVTVTLTAWATNAAPDYLVVDLTATNRPPRETVTYYPSAEAVPFGVTNAIYKTTKLVMRKIPAGGVRWAMGSPEGEAGRVAGNEVQHYVTLSSDYYMGIYPVTAGQYQQLKKETLHANADVCKAPIPADADLHPISAVAYAYSNDNPYHWLRNNAAWPTNQSHTGRVLYSSGYLAKLQGLTGIEFDLPTSAQWEFACRAGSTGPVYGGYAVGDVGWYSGNTNRTVAVGLMKPNAWGLYDMLGNVWEWCRDIYVNKTMSDAEVFDPAGPTQEEAGFAAANQVKFARRGGNYTSDANTLRSANVDGRAYTGSDQMLGFRVCCPAGATW